MPTLDPMDQAALDEIQKTAERLDKDRCAQMDAPSMNMVRNAVEILRRAEEARMIAIHPTPSGLSVRFFVIEAYTAYREVPL